MIGSRPERILRRTIGILACSASLLAQTPTASPTPTSQVVQIDSLWGASAPVKINVEPGITGSFSGDLPEGMDDIPAKACVFGSNNCFVAKDKDYDYGDAKTSVLEIGKGKSTLELLATFAGASDSSTQIVLLGIDSHGKLVNLLPRAGYTLQDSYRFWRDASISEYQIFTVANFIWGTNDGHFGPHHFNVTTFLFCPAVGKYMQFDTFKTRRFSADDGGKTVLNAEMSVVKNHLAKNKAAGTLCPRSKP